MMAETEHILKRLTKGQAKGENGCILVIGGSELYTGAPLFVAKAALRTGSDLVYIFTQQDALLTLKKLEEAIVLPIGNNKRILAKITACVVGPGLGRISSSLLSTIVDIIKYLDSRNVPIIVDADAIHYYKTGVFSFVKTCVITPNQAEANGLHPEGWHILVQKGVNDVISTGSQKRVVTDRGSDKRCGGQGDILAGVLATALSICEGETVQACVDSCVLVRKAAQQAFTQKSYGLITEDIIETLPAAIKRILSE